MKNSTKLKIEDLLSRLKLLSLSKKFLSAIRRIKIHSQLLKDEFIWRKLNKNIKLSKDEWGFVCNLHNGDTYIFCSYMEAFKQKYGGKVTVVVKKSQYSIPAMFPTIDKIKVSSHLPSEYFGNLYSNSEPKKGFLRLGYPYGYRSILSCPQNIFNWFDLFKLQLKLDLSSSQSKPVIPCNLKKQSIAELRTLIKNDFIPLSKIVVISPYSYSSPFDLEKRFWVELTKKLKSLGYFVMTNASKKEEIIDGTLKIDFEFQKFITIVEEIGFIIGIRSGLFDIISSSNCKKIILYPNYIYPLTNIKYKSMDVLSKDPNVTQIEFDENADNDNLISHITECIVDQL